MYKFSLLIALACFCFSTFAQKNGLPKTEDVTLAKKLAKKYEDAKIVALESSDIFEFGYDAKTKNVTVTEKNYERLFSVKTNAKILQTKFYDATSEVKNVTVKYRNNRRVTIDPKYENYNQSGIFYSDAKVCYFPLNFKTQGFQYQVDESFDQNPL